MLAGPPRPRPWPVDTPKTLGEDGVVKLTAPHAYAMWCAVVGYHVPKSLANAQTASRGLTLGR